MELKPREIDLAKTHGLEGMPVFRPGELIVAYGLWGASSAQGLGHRPHLVHLRRGPELATDSDARREGPCAGVLRPYRRALFAPPDQAVELCAGALPGLDRQDPEE